MATLSCVRNSSPVCRRDTTGTPSKFPPLYGRLDKRRLTPSPRSSFAGMISIISKINCVCPIR